MTNDHADVSTEVDDDSPLIEAKTPRKTRYRVKYHLDGADECTLTIERGTTHQLAVLRPKGKRQTYTLALADVAGLIAYRVAKNLAEQRILDGAATKRAKKYLPRRGKR